MEIETQARLQAWVGFFVRLTFGAGVGLVLAWLIVSRWDLEGTNALLAYAIGGGVLGLLAVVFKDELWTTVGDSPVWRVLRWWR